MSDFTAHISDSFVAWAAARPKNDFKAVTPFLTKTLDFSRRYSSYFPMQSTSPTRTSLAPTTA